jgi:hypothetical protein
MVAGLLAVGGCARPAPPQAYDGGGIVDGRPPIGAQALDGWSDFPAGQHPRLIVLMYGPVLNPGFRTDEAKMAGIDAGYALAASLPPAPPATLPVTLPDGPAQLPSVDAAGAFATLRSYEAPKEPHGTPVPLTGVTLGTAKFHTDRGELTLPAWLFTGPDLLDPIALPALSPKAFWRFDRVAAAAAPMPAKVAADGRTLTVPVPQGASCDGTPAPPVGVVKESAGAVAIGSQPASVAPQRTDCILPAYLRFVDITVRLAAPLGARVLVDGTGNAFEVQPAG